jgi:hypothetical protein
MVELAVKNEPVGKSEMSFCQKFKDKFQLLSKESRDQLDAINKNLGAYEYGLFKKGYNFRFISPETVAIYVDKALAVYTMQSNGIPSVQLTDLHLLAVDVINESIDTMNYPKINAKNTFTIPMYVGRTARTPFDLV